MLLSIPGFQGQVNVLGPQRIDDSQATEAKNCLIQSGDLVPFHVPLTQVSTGITPTGNDTIFLHPSRWITWPGPVKVVRAPSADDAKRRIYFSDGTNFRVSDSDILGGGYGPPAASRKVGLPIPSLSDPTFDQQGTGTVVSVEVWATNDSRSIYLPRVQCSATHKLKTNQSVMLNVPGFTAQGPYTVVLVSGDTSTQFRIRGFKLKKANFSSITKAANVDSAGQPAVVKSNNHPFNDGDVVAVHWTKDGTNDSAWITKDTAYSVGYEDTGSYSLLEIEATSSTSKRSISSRGKQISVCVHDATDPFYGTKASNGNEGLPDFSWVSDANGCFKITAYADAASNSNTWTKTDVAALLQDRVYVATFVNYYGEEGPPSDPTGDIILTQGTAVTFASLPTTSLNGPTDYNIQYVRLYRTDSNGNYRLVPKTDSEGIPVKDSNGNVIYDIPYGTTNFVDKAMDSQLAEVLPTQGWYEPPSNLQGVTLLPGGVLVGFVDKSIYACVPYIASAWPYEYQLKTDYPIVGLVNTQAGIVVLTQGTPALIIGTDPATWGLVKLESAQAAVSARSIVDMGDYAVYASPFGLVGIQQNDANVLTDSVFSRLQWQGYTPSNIKASFFEGKYFGSNGSQSFIFTPATRDFVQIDTPFSAFYNDLSTDTLYILQSNGTIAAWDRGSSLQTYSWTSKIFQVPYPANFGAAQVVSEATVSNPVTFYFYADGVLKHTQTVTDTNTFRLPGGFRAQEFQIKVTGAARVKTIAVASSVDELGAI